jgi:hypothetical protein
MRTTEWMSRGLLCLPLVLAVAGLAGCKSVSERYIALEVWKYEKCFGHLPPGFTPPGAAAPMAAATMRPCGQPAPCAAPVDACSQCGEGSMGAVVDGGMPMMSGPAPAGATMPAPGPAAVTSSRPVVISDEVVLP